MRDNNILVILLVLAALIFLLVILMYDRIERVMMPILTSRRKNVSSLKNTHVINYKDYNMPLKETVLNIFIAAIGLSFCGFFFYRSIGLTVLILPLSLLYPKMKKREIIEKRKSQILYQFRDSLYLLSASLQAGKSIEMSFVDAYKGLFMQYADPNTCIIKEFNYINKKIEMNETIENTLTDFAERSGVEEIQTFADVFQTCKRSGGNLIQVIRSTADIINEKTEVKQEIDTLLTERKFEQKVLMFMPIAIVMLVSSSASDFIRPIFTTIQGRLAMTVALGLMIAAYFISKHITDIEV